jgi:hypothetical protein
MSPKLSVDSETESLTWTAVFLQIVTFLNCVIHWLSSGRNRQRKTRSPMERQRNGFLDMMTLKYSPVRKVSKSVVSQSFSFHTSSHNQISHLSVVPPIESLRFSILLKILTVWTFLVSVKNWIPSDHDQHFQIWIFGHIEGTFIKIDRLNKSQREQQSSDEGQ